MELSEAQAAALDALRLTPHAAGADIRTLLRFLRAARYRVDGAAEMLRRNAEWRDANFPLGQLPGSVPLEAIHATLQQRRFYYLPKRNVDGRRVLHLSLRDFSNGSYQVTDNLVALVYLLEEIVGEEGTGGELVALIDVSGANRPPTALLQRATALLSSYYPGVLRSTVLYPVGAVGEQMIREMLPFCDVGGVTESSEVVCCSTLADLTDSLGLSDTDPSALSIADLPDSVRVARPLSEVVSGRTAGGGRPLPMLPGWGRAQPYALQKLSRRSEQGEFVVHTPWYPDGVVQHHLSLEEEMVEFTRFMLLSSAERRRRDELRTSLQGLVARVWHEATVKTVGALACGLSQHARPVQFAVEGCGDAALLPAVFEQLEQSELSVAAPAAELIQGGCFVRLATPAGISAEVSFHGGKSAARKAVPVLRGWLKEFPAARPVQVVLVHVLEQSKSIGCENGGLTAKALLVMVLHVCRLLHSQHTGRTLSPELVLRRFLTYFGSEFDFAAWAVDPHVLHPAPKTGGCPVEVLDPADRSRNCAADCTRMLPIRLQFQYCDTALAKWGRCSAHSRGFRGRTPLSTIVSYEPLWDRRRELNAGLSLLRSPPSSSPSAGSTSPCESPRNEECVQAGAEFQA